MARCVRRSAPAAVPRSHRQALRGLTGGWARPDQAIAARRSRGNLRPDQLGPSHSQRGDCVGRTRQVYLSTQRRPRIVTTSLPYVADSESCHFDLEFTRDRTAARRPRPGMSYTIQTVETLVWLAAALSGFPRPATTSAGMSR